MPIRPHLLHLLAASLVAFLTACSSGSNSSGPPAGDDPPDPDPLSLEGFVVDPNITTINVSWATSVPTTGAVEWGETALLGNRIENSAMTDMHMVVIPNLEPDTVYYVRVESVGADGQSVDAGPLSTLTLIPTGFASSDFNQPNLEQGTFTFVDPAGQAQLALEGSGSGQAFLRLSVPAGVSYQPWLTNGAARVTQDVADEDIALQASFIGALDVNGTGHGLTFEEANDTFLRFDFAYNQDRVQLFAATFRDGAQVNIFTENLFDGPRAAGEPLDLRVTRSGDTWTQEWSDNGSTWQTGAVFNFPLALQNAGLFVANSGNPPVAHEMLVDYVFQLGSEISPEDGGTPNDALPPLLYRSETQAAGSTSIRTTWFTDELASGEVRFGLDTTYSGGTVPVTSLAHSHSIVIPDLLPGTEYHFQIIATDPSGQSSTSSDLVESTLDEGQLGSPTLTFWTGLPNADGVQVHSFGQNGDPQAQVNVLGVVDDDDELNLVDSLTLQFRLNNGPLVDIPIGNDRNLTFDPWRLANEGDFNIELFTSELASVPLIAGVHRNELEIRAIDDDGNLAVVTSFVDYTPGVDWPLPTTVSWADVNNLHQGDVGQIAQVVDGDWFVDEAFSSQPLLRLEPDALGYDRLVAIGQSTGPNAWTDYEARTQLTPLALDPLGFTTGTGSFAIGFIMRWCGHTADGPFPAPLHNIYPFGGGFFFRWFPTRERWQFWQNENEQITGLSGNDLSLGVCYEFRLRVETLPSGGSRYRMRLWPTSTPEPDQWTFDETTSGLNDHPSGSFLLVAHHVDVLIGDVTIVPLP